MTYTLNYLRFIWFENVGNPNLINIYRFTRLAFGLTSSPFTLLFLVRTHFVRTVMFRLSKN